MSHSAIVIGAGVTGLTLGMALQRAGRAFRVLEKSDHVGGAIRSIKRDGYLAEAGPNSMLVNSAALESLLKGLGLGPHMQRPGDEAKNRYILKNGEFVAAPAGPGNLLSTPLISGAAKWRVLRDLVARKPAELREESLACFIERHFGPEILEYAVNPFVGGIYAGDPRKLSAQHAFPMLAEAENEAGSVIRGLIKRRKAKRARGEAFKSYSLSFAGGMQTLADTLAGKLSRALSCGVDLLAIEQVDMGWSVTWRDTEGNERTDMADELFITTPAHQLSQLPLPGKVQEALAPLSLIEYPPVSVVAIGYDRSQISHPLDGFGGLIPEEEKRDVLGVLFSSSLFPSRAPEGKVLLTAFIGGARQPDLAQKPQGELREIAKREVNQLLGARGEPEFCEITTWPKAIPQYNVGYGAMLATIEAAESSFPGLRLLGNYRGGISVGQCMINAAAAVEPLG